MGDAARHLPQGAHLLTLHELHRALLGVLALSGILHGKNGQPACVNFAAILSQVQREATTVGTPPCHFVLLRLAQTVGNEAPHRLADELGGRVAEHPLGGSIDPFDLALLIHTEHAVGDAVENGPHPLLALLELADQQSQVGRHALKGRAEHVGRALRLHFLAQVTRGDGVGDARHLLLVGDRIIHGGGHLAKLVAGAHRHVLVQVAPGQTVRCLRHLTGSSGYIARQHKPHQQSERRGADGRGDGYATSRFVGRLVRLGDLRSDFTFLAQERPDGVVNLVRQQGALGFV